MEATKEKALKEEASKERERFVRFHWQNLNDKKGGGQGSGWREGRCWWHFRKNRTVQFSWSLWTTFCMAGFDIDDEDLTFHVGFPPVAFWLSFSTNWWLVNQIAPKKVLSPDYPNTIVIDERECQIAIHDWCLWIHPWSKSMEWVKKDPWWVRGVTLHLNPFEWRYMRTEVRRPDGTWVLSGESDKLGEPSKPDGREVMTYPYRYALKNGTVQDRTATVYAERRAWRPRCLRWTGLIEKVRTSIDVIFSDEVGERSGSWKGGCTGCGYELRPGEDMEQCLRRMERERKF